jgi:hypothetical protein
VIVFYVLGLSSGEDSGSEEDDQEMDVDAAKQTGEVSQALAVANALGRSSKVNKSETKFDDIADGLQELDMDKYDDEEDGTYAYKESIFLFPFLLCTFFYLIHFVENKRVIGRHAGLVWEVRMDCLNTDLS